MHDDRLQVPSTGDPPPDGCVVHIDAAHRGLGTASCGPDTLPAHRIRPGPHRWAWTPRAR
jgi:beta-galactosidase